jgi:hypothetical protein
MAFTLTFPTNAPLPAAEDVAAWLTEQGEPFDLEGPTTLALRALPVRLLLGADSLQGWLEVTSTAPLVRLVDLLFALSVLAGADVHLAGSGQMTRPRLWLRLADEQDRQRIAEAMARADEHGNREDVGQRLWAVLSAIWPGRDLRWDASRSHIVELVEVAEPGGISVEEASWLVEGAAAGDVVARPIGDYLHIIAWRWLSEAYPGLAEG